MRTIVLDTRARRDLLQGLDYLEEQFGTAAADRLNQRVIEVLDLLREQPELGAPAPAIGQGVRRLVLHGRLTVYYTPKPQHIFIHHFHDTRLPPPEDV